MKRKLTLAAMTLLLTIGLSSAAAHADTVSFTLTNPVQYASGTAGDTLTYEVTATASASNGAAVDLGFDSFNLDSPLSLDDIDLFLDGPPSLNPGDSATFDLFTITVPAGTTAGDYYGFFTVLDGSFAELGTVSFTTTVTPEPGSFILLGTGLAGVFATHKRKRFGGR